MRRHDQTEQDTRRQLGIPPTFDVAPHLRELMRVSLPALAAALVVASAAYVVAASDPDEYQQTVTATIDAGTGANTTEVTLSTLAPPFVALSQSRPVLDDVLTKSGVEMTSDELAENLVVDVKTSPSLVEVSATAGSGSDALALARATVEALDDAIINISIDKITKDVVDLQRAAAATADEISALPDPSPERDVRNAEYASQVARARDVQSTPPTRIRLLSQPDNAEKVAPRPLQQSLVVLIGSWFVLAELLAALNGRIGRRTSRAWIRRQARKRGYRVLHADSGTGVWPSSTQIALNQLTRGADLLVLYSSESAEAQAYVHAATAGVDSVTIAATDALWWQEPTNVSRPLAIVVVDSRSADRTNLANSFEALDEYHIPTEIVAITSDNRPARPAKHATSPA